MDESPTVALSLECPSCHLYLPVNQAGPSTLNTYLPTPPGAAILARYTNEGGLQDGLDILPAITEEAYLESNPEARPARALHLMASEGDVAGIVELLRHASDQLTDIGLLLRYQDPLSSMKSALHLAVENDQDEVFWLLLWLSSTLPNAAFPDPARQAAEAMAITRHNVAPNTDIRSLRDSNGRTAGDLAGQLSGSWSALREAGVLTP